MAEHRAMDADARRRLLKIAQKAFAEQGYGGTSLNWVLVQAKVSKGRFYYYFKDKQALYQVVLEQAFGPIMEDLVQLERTESAEDFWQVLDSVMERSLFRYASDPMLMALAHQALAPGRSPEEREVAETVLLEALDRTAQVLQHGQRLGAIRRDMDVNLLAHQLLGMDSATDRWLAGGQAERASLDLGDQGEGLFAIYRDLYRRLLLPRRRLAQWLEESDAGPD